MSALNPRSPLVLDTRELGRRPGSMKRVSRTVPAPSGLGIEVLRVPEGAEIALELRLESVMEGVLVSGTATTIVDGECVRCLDPVRQDVVVDVQELYVYDGRRLADDEDEVRALAGDLLDIEPVLRDSIVLELPLQPVCDAECPGLCSECGQRLAENPDHAHETVDARWAALVGLLDNGSEGQNLTSEHVDNQNLDNGDSGSSSAALDGPATDGSSGFRSAQPQTVGSERSGPDRPTFDDKQER